MTIVLNDPVVRQDIIDRFNARIRDLVIAETDWVGSTVIVAGRTLNTITSGSTSGSTSAGGNYPGSYPAGSYNRTALSTKEPDPIEQVDFSAEIGGKENVVGHVLNVLKTFMTLYANTHKMDLRNTGNLTTTGARTSFNLVTHTGVARLSDVLSSVKTSVESDITNSSNNRNIKTGALITATNLINFIEDCRAIWQNRCLNSAVEEFRYSYCHSSCHSNHGSHGSRGRR